MGKNKFLLVLISLVLMIGVSAIVSAAGDGKNNTNATLTLIKISDFSNAPTLVGGIYYVNNATYTFNITVANRNASHNVTGINISLGTALRYVDDSNATDSATANWESGIQFIKVNNSRIRWNKSDSTFLLNFNQSSTNNSAWFAFNATFNQSDSSDGLYNITVWAEMGNVETYASAYYIIQDNITIDNIAPVLLSGATHNTTHFNVTFTETNGILINTLRSGGVFNVTTPTGTVLSPDGVPDQTGSNTTIVVNVTTPYSKNETPVVVINSTSITDWAGNNVTMNATTTASDKIRPSLLTVGLEYNYSTKNLTLIFDEPIHTNIYVAGINLTDNGTATGEFLLLNDGNTSYVVYGNALNKTVINFSDEFRDTLLGWKPGPQTSMNISLFATAFNDTHNNTVNNVSEQGINLFTVDTTAPTLTSAKYDHESKMLNLTFSETMNFDFAGAGNITIGNQSNLSSSSLTQQITLAGAVTYNNIPNSTTVQINLTQTQAWNLSMWRVPILYIHNNITGNNRSGFQDLSGNNATEISNSSALGYINISGGTYTNDTTLPFLTLAISLNDSSPTRAGTVQFNVTFNEFMDRTTTTINVTLYPNATGSDFALVSGGWVNYTFWNGSFTINDSWDTDVGDGTITINVSGARDVAYNTMTRNNTNEFRIDTVYPTLSMVWYNDTGYDYNFETGAQNGTDFLILKFSENVTVVSANDSTAIYTANGTTTNGAFFGNNSHSQGATFLRLSDYKKVKVSINNTMSAIWVRGVYNATGKVQGIIVKNATTSITDLAGNPLVNHSGVQDIYDNALTYTSDANGVIDWTGFSIPYEINTSITGDAITSYTSQIYTHNGTTWVSRTASQLIPYQGYLIKITGVGSNNTVDIPIATKEFVGQGGGNTWTQKFIVDDGEWSLLGIDGVLDNDATDLRAAGEWLSTFGAGDNSKVSIVRNTDSTNSEVTFSSYTAGSLKPYMSFWVFTQSKADSSSYNFAGYGRW